MTPEQLVIFGMLLIMALIVFFAVYSVRVYEEQTKRGTSIKREYEEPASFFQDLEWAVLLSHEMQTLLHLPEGKLKAIQLYEELTGVSFEDAEKAIEYFIKHPNHAPIHLRRNDEVQGQINQIRELLRQGKHADARHTYQELTGADDFEIHSALNQLEKEAQIEQEHFERLRSIADENSSGAASAQ